MIPERLSQQTDFKQREMERFGLSPDMPLAGLSADGAVRNSSDSRVTTVGDLLTKTEGLLCAPEALFCQETIQRVMSNSMEYPIVLPPQALLSPSEFEGYAFRYKSSGSYINPAEDVYVVTGQNGEPISYGCRSAICPPLANTPAIDRILTLNGSPVCVGGLQPCLRQEVQTDQKRIRFPWFTQTDIEMIANVNPDTQRDDKTSLDTYSCMQMIWSLQVSGIPLKDIRLRLNNYMQIIVPILGDAVPWVDKEIFGYQALDKLAGARAEGTSPSDTEYISLQQKAFQLLENLKTRFSMDDERVAFFQQLIQTGEYNFSLLNDTDATKIPEANRRLLLVVDSINRFFDTKIASIDPLSYRGGYPGYDKTTMQADIFTKNRIFAEVAGGGAYPKALQEASLILKAPNLAKQSAYAVGFAFGNARVYEAVKAVNPGLSRPDNINIVSWKTFQSSQKNYEIQNRTY